MRQQIYDAQRAINAAPEIEMSGRVKQTFDAVGKLLSVITPIVSDKSLKFWNILKVYKLAYAAWDFVQAVIAIWKSEKMVDNG